MIEGKADVVYGSRFLGGARIDPGSSHADMISLFAGSGHLFREQVHMSGVVPQVDTVGIGRATIKSSLPGAGSSPRRSIASRPWARAAR